MQQKRYCYLQKGIYAQSKERLLLCSKLKVMRPTSSYRAIPAQAGLET